MSNTVSLPTIHRRRDDYFPPSPPLSTTTPPSASTNKQLNLDHLIQAYGNQPELLELILSSKVEEDRRLAEEAKLKSKEIDYVLHQRRQSYPQPAPYHAFVNRETSTASSLLPPITTTTASTSHSATLPPIQTHVLHNRGPSAKTSSNNIDMLLTRPTSPPTPKLPSISTAFQTKPLKNDPSPLFMNQSNGNDYNRSRSLSFTLATPTAAVNGYSSHRRSSSSTSTSTSTNSSNQSNLKKPLMKRRRREMQAISTIIETREFPYNDDYLWKNNGNTVHKKTGFRSIYYKCSNSLKGCCVNKTVTFKEDGLYLIKYRGKHLPECNRIKRISDL